MKSRWFLLVILATATVLADEDPTRTLNIVNGRGWQRLRASGHAEAYLTGLYDGLNYYGQHAEFRTDRASVGLTSAEISAGVTAFYAADSARLRIPVPMAVALFLRHAEGESDEQMAERVAKTLRDLDSWVSRARTPKR